ncbi:rod shape-determining protein MreC [Flagellatimonas centrodinii]|nr:rod shape-determining protein MreC [Flagellatimonas centrodinii]
MFCALALILTDARGERLQLTREIMTTALTPLIWVASLPTRAGIAADRMQSRESLARDNAELRQRLMLLQVRAQKLDALEAENRRIRELLASREALDEKVLIAEIIAINQDPYRHQITLNKGIRDGVYRGQALVDAHGVLGQVVEVSPSLSQALLITDPDHGIPVEVNRTGLQTIAVGRGDGQGLKLPFLPSNADIKEGDLLVSSPLGGRFPAGYPVGRIHTLRHTAGEHFLEALAHPSAQLNQGRQALLVWSERRNTETPAADAEAAAINGGGDAAAPDMPPEAPTAAATP